MSGRGSTSLVPATLTTLTAELGQAGIADPEVVRNLVEQRVSYGPGTRRGVAVKHFQRPPEDGYLARHRRAGGAESRARDPLVETEQAAHPGGRQLFG